MGCSLSGIFKVGYLEGTVSILPACRFFLTFPGSLFRRCCAFFSPFPGAGIHTTSNLLPMLATLAPVKGDSGSRRDGKGEVKVKNQAAQPGVGGGGGGEEGLGLALLTLTGFYKKHFNSCRALANLFLAAFRLFRKST